MSALSPSAALALPILSDEIPFAYRVAGDDGISAPLALALLETPAITNKMLDMGPNALLLNVLSDLQERDLAVRALTNWWRQLQRRHPMRIFKWDLVICDSNTLPDGTFYRNSADFIADHAWFCIRRAGDRDRIPRFTLAQATEKLEKRLKGFGQTVLAVLYDAMRHLPEAFTPWMATDLAEMMYWSEAENDAELIALARANGDDPEDLITRAKFFEGMPKWISRPQRQCKRGDIVRASREGWEQRVIAACDDIAGLVNSPDFDVPSQDCGVQHASHDTIDGMVCMTWTGIDQVGQVIDDWLNDLGACGEYVDFIDMQNVPLTSKGVSDWMRRTTNMQQLARLTERLITLIGEPY